MDQQVLHAGEGRAFPFAGGTLTIKEDGSRTRGELTAVEIVLPAQSSPPWQHLHHRHEESWYVLEGQLDFTVGKETVRVGPGGLGAGADRRSPHVPQQRRRSSAISLDDDPGVLPPVLRGAGRTDQGVAREWGTTQPGDARSPGRS